MTTDATATEIADLEAECRALAEQVLLCEDDRARVRLQLTLSAHRARLRALKRGQA